jgi:hypothetical protein
VTMKPEIKEIMNRLSDIEDKLAYILGEDVSEDKAEGEDMSAEEENMGPEMQRQHRMMKRQMAEE